MGSPKSAARLPPIPFVVCIEGVDTNVSILHRRVIIMLKYPLPGAVKTRLVSALGEHRACELYRALVAHTISEATKRSVDGEGPSAIEVRLAGAPDESAARAWLGSAVSIREQGDGNLGQRMERAIVSAFGEGAEAVVVIGGDCPQLTATHLVRAFAALAQADTVLGPASDGGYYLIGLRRPLPALFHGISWGGPEVFSQTVAAARALQVEPALLPTLRDVDVPDDLVVWAATPAARAGGRSGVSVIVPARNEETSLGPALVAAAGGAPHEIIVVDGGSTDRTAEVARAHDAILVSAPAGRARQMNHGAAVATGEFLLFLHADTVLPPNYLTALRATLAQPGVVGGAFRFSISGEFSGRRLIECGTNFRARHRQLPYGDQGLFVSRTVFERVCGFPDQPLMEDYAFVRRLQRLGTIAIAPAGAVTAGRRWQRRGAIRTTLLNQLIICGYRLGVSPVRLARWYRGE